MAWIVVKHGINAQNTILGSYRFYSEAEGHLRLVAGNATVKDGSFSIVFEVSQNEALKTN